MTQRDLDCCDLVEVVTDYLEGRLAPDQVERFDAHLAICPGCDAYVAQIRAVMRLGEEARARELPALVEHLLPAFRTYRRGLA
jgi:anti-sigma factor RsiW